MVEIQKFCYSLPKNIILKNTNEIRKILQTGEKLTGKRINLFWLKTGEARFAVLIPKRIGNAVKRNKMKRLAREIYRNHKEWFRDREILFFIKRFDDAYDLLKEEVARMVMRR